MNHAVYVLVKLWQSCSVSCCDGARLGRRGQDMLAYRCVMQGSDEDE